MNFRCNTEVSKNGLSRLLQGQECEDGTTTWYISYPSLFCIICELDEDALCPIVQDINEDIELSWVQ